MKNGNKAYYNDIATNYDKDRIIEPIWNEEQSFISNYISERESGSTILDVPVGTGRFIDIYLKKKMHVIGIDISDDMLSEAQKKFENNNLVNLECGDATALSFGDGSVDYVVCWRLVHLLDSENLDLMISELSRVCRKEIVIQIYETTNKAPSIYFRILRKIRTTTKKIFTKREKLGKKSWGNIKFFYHRDEEMTRLFAKYRLIIKKTSILGENEPLNREKVYTVRKEV